MTDSPGAEPASRRTGSWSGRGSILAGLGWGFALLFLLLGGFVALMVWAGLAAQAEVSRAEQSFRQLETAQTIEAAFNRYLVEEVDRRLAGADPDAARRAATAVRQALLAHRRMIGSEIVASGSAGERVAERGELIRSGALDELFAAIETEALLERSREAPAEMRARLFMDQVAAERARTFRAILFEIGADERGEIDAAAAALRTIRTRTLVLGAGIGLAFLGAGLFFGAFLRDGLRRPIRALESSAIALASGGRTARAPEDLPGEFRLLGREFNRMARELAERESALEAKVAARTRELANTNDELRRIDESRRRFFANVSHELRTPVTVLLGEAQLARRRPGDAAVMAEALARIDASGGFLRRRLDDLMRLARSEDGSMAIEMSSVTFPDPVAEAVDLALGYASANEVRLVFEPCDPVMMQADADALRQAVLALIDNAVKFSPPDSEVRVVATTETGTAMATVMDEGPGFEGSGKAVLNRYAQEGQGRAAGGTGLGLSIALWVAEQHGGTLRAGNRAPGGAAVTLEIPR